MTHATPFFDANAADQLGIHALPGLFYAIPAPLDVIGLCLGCGEEVRQNDAVTECECWSSATGEPLPALMHTACFEEATDELV